MKGSPQPVIAFPAWKSTRDGAWMVRGREDCVTSHLPGTPGAPTPPPPNPQKYAPSAGTHGGLALAAACVPPRYHPAPRVAIPGAPQGTSASGRGVLGLGLGGGGVVSQLGGVPGTGEPLGAGLPVAVPAEGPGLVGVVVSRPPPPSAKARLRPPRGYRHRLGSVVSPPPRAAGCRGCPCPGGASADWRRRRPHPGGRGWAVRARWARPGAARPRGAAAPSVCCRRCGEEEGGHGGGPGG